MTIEHRHQPIVVAVNGTAESVAALEWAATEATRSGRPLTVVTAYRHPQAVADDPGTFFELHDHAREAARQLAATAIANVTDPEAVEHVVALGPITDILRSYGPDAAMIVVGTRPTESWRCRLRGSVTNRLTGTVPCPVVAIPPTVRSGHRHPAPSPAGLDMEAVA